MKEKLFQILLNIAPQTDLNSITDSTRLNADLGLNSINLMMMIMEIEDTFGFEFRGDESFETVGEVCDYINGRIGK